MERCLSTKIDGIIWYPAFCNQKYYYRYYQQEEKTQRFKFLDCMLIVDASTSTAASIKQQELFNLHPTQETSWYHRFSFWWGYRYIDVASASFQIPLVVVDLYPNINSTLQERNQTTVPVAQQFTKQIYKGKSKYIYHKNAYVIVVVEALEAQPVLWTFGHICAPCTPHHW